MKGRYGPWALIVGASDGIGAAFAEALAARGLNVVLVARRAAPLNALADRLNSVHNVRTRELTADAATAAGIETIATAPEEIGLLVVNAALGPVGPFDDLTPSELDAMVDLNCRAAVQLSHAFGGAMLSRGRGGVVLMSSMAGFRGTGSVVHYAATKAYLRVLAEGLWHEWRPSGVDVLACCPGLVQTPTYERGQPRPSRLVPPPMSPARVAAAALGALGRRPVVIPGRRNRAAAALAALLPRRSAIALTSRQTAFMFRRP
jgi:short-subunit dehydrogenase